ncbi:MAG: hypothetical protein ACUVRL_06545 [Candidatus Saccharicenans sp.]
MSNKFFRPTPTMTGAGGTGISLISPPEHGHPRIKPKAIRD